MAHHKKGEQEDHGESAPLWIVSFADLVTLMLSFFVILAIGNPKDSGKSPEFAELVTALRAAFGNNAPAAEAALGPATDFETLVRRLMALAKNTKPPARGDTQDKGIPGRSFRVRRLGDGMEITIGGPVFFEPFSIKPTEEGQRQLQQVVDICKGHRNVIEVRGHVGEGAYPSDWTHRDAMTLSYARAEYVGEVLLENGIDPAAVRLVAVGPNEPAVRQTYDPAQRALSRRVEVIIRESVIDDYVGREPTGWSSTSQPAS